MSQDRRAILAAAGLVAVALALLAAMPPWAVSLVSVGLAKGIVVLGLMLTYRAGLMSFGQGLYFCLGAYTAGVLAQFAHVTDALGLVLAGTLVATSIGLALGTLLSRYRSIFFGLLSMAFSMILYGLLVKSATLGSTDGFTLPALSIVGNALPGRSAGVAVYVLTALAAAICVYAIARYLDTPLGRLAPAIRDNEIRVEYLGASVRAAIHYKYVISAALAGAGGALTALTVGHIDPEMAYWTTSGEFVFITVFAGAGSVLAPFLGAVLFEALRSYAYTHSPNTWQMVVGGSMLAVIVFLPEGLWSLFSRRGRTA